MRGLFISLFALILFFSGSEEISATSCRGSLETFLKDNKEFQGLKEQTILGILLFDLAGVFRGRDFRRKVAARGDIYIFPESLGRLLIKLRDLKWIALAPEFPIEADNAYFSVLPSAEREMKARYREISGG